MLGDRFAGVLARTRDGDTAAFTELWRDVQPMLLRYLTITAGQDAEDVASQTWIRAIGSLRSFGGDEVGFRRWIATVARNIDIDRIRYSARRPETLIDPHTTVDLFTRQTTASPADRVEQQDATDNALALVATLPADQAEMVVLRVVMGLSVADVAEVLGRRPGAVRVAVHRGLKKLKRQVDDAGRRSDAGRHSDAGQQSDAHAPDVFDAAHSWRGQAPSTNSEKLLPEGVTGSPVTTFRGHDA